MLGVIFLVVAVIGAFHTFLALFGPRRPAFLSAAFFFGGWLAGDLAWFHIAWQAVVVGAFVALGALEEFSGRIALLVTLASWIGLTIAHRRHLAAERVLEHALVQGLGVGYRDEIHPHLHETLRHHVPSRELLRPFRPKASGVAKVRDLAYGEHERQSLDLVKPEEDVEAAPVLLQIHGGAWVTGEKHQQAQPLMHYLASRGWICVAINYRLAPAAKYPEQLLDCKRALAWIRENIAEHGGDPNCVIVTGGSAGGHLSALMGLTANDTRFQPGFEAVDTSVAAAVPMYGVYDLVGRTGIKGDLQMRPFLERMVMPTSLEEDPGAWDSASPITRVHSGAPPFFVVHGGYDSLVWAEGARAFEAALRSVSHEPVVYAEVPYAQHAFDVMTTVRSVHTVNAIARFCEWVRSRPSEDAWPEAVRSES